MAILTPQASLKQLEFLLTMSPGFQARVIGDPERIRQVLFNLIANAIKFTDKGEVSLKISRRQTKQAGYLHIGFEVQDTGAGISPDKLQLIFDKFTQADGTITRQYGGTGLGLTISKQLVELMGGSLQVRTELKQGSCFYFSLDLPEVDTHSDTPTDSQLSEHTEFISRLGEAQYNQQFNSSSTPCKGLVLLVDDQMLNQKVGCYMLQDLNYQTDIALSGQQALQAIQSKHFDLILIDCHMPDMDGFETTRLIREYEAEKALQPVPIIAVTADVQSGVTERCLQSGMNGYLSKPFNLQQLEATLKQWLG